MTRARFKKLILDHYRKAGRHSLPWRNTRDPYRVLVSEVMLQQTQVVRVLSKYEEFLKTFPTVEALAKAPIDKLLRVWQGLGYNRRALNLKRAAEMIVRGHKGKFPPTKEGLEGLPGIGPSTSGGILAYSFDIPSVFIETNIRTVFIHFFFNDQTSVHDKDILPLIEGTLDQKNPREWYYALMDYGVHLKQTRVNPSRRSKHHSKQSSFKGSNRELRSNILKLALEKDLSRDEIVSLIGKTKHDVMKNIEDLAREGFLRETDGLFAVSRQKKL